ncbi:autotransporter domain-containing protein [Lysobacter sp. A289]
MNRDLAGWLRCALIPGLLGLACWAPQASASSFCQVINNPDGTPRSGSVANGGGVDLNDVSWASNVGDTVSLEISNITAGSTGYFSGAGISLSFSDAGAFQETVGSYYSGGSGSISLSSDTGGFDYTISCASAPPVLASVSPASGEVGTSVTLSGQSLYGFDNEVSITIGGVAATFDNNDGTSITVIVPAGLAAGSHDVTVTTDAGASTLPDAFTILAANQPPVINAPGSQAVEQDGALVFSSDNGNLISVGDPDAGGGTMQVELVATNGLTTLGNAGGLTFLVGDGTGDAAMTFQGTLSNINAALNGTTYTPTSGYSGSASLQIVSDDLGNTGTGGAMTDTDVVTITVLELDTDPPEVTAIDRVDASPTNAGRVHYAVTFSEAVTGVDATDFALAATGTAAGTVAQVATSDSIQYTVTVNGVGGDGSLRLDLNGSGTGIIDGAGNVAAGFTGGQVYIVDATAPAVTSVDVPANGRYLANDVLDFAVHMSEDLDVDTSGGTPHLELTLGSTLRQASYQSGSGTSVLVFSYTVASGDRDDDGMMLAETIEANGATLRDAVGNDAAPALNAVGNTTGVLVGKGDQTITFDAQAAQAFVAGGTFALDPVATASSGLPVGYATQTAGVCAISGTTVTMQSAGTCTIAADQAGNGDYDAAPTVTQDIVIGQGSQTISFGAQAAQAFVPGGTFALDPVATASSGLPVGYATQTAGVCAISGTTVTMQSAGTCTIGADQAGNGDYAAAPTVTQGIVIGQGSQTISFGAQAAKAFVPGGTFALDPVATASSGLPVGYATQTAGVCTISGITVTMQSAGTCTIAADQAGDADYEAAPTVTQDIVIGQGSQTISFGAQAAQAFVAGGTFVLDPVATASSGLPVGYATQTAGVCAISGTTVTMQSAGTCTIAADQAGDANYAAAPTVTQDIAIGQAAQAITAFAADPVAPAFVPEGTFTVSATGGASGNPVLFGTATPTVCAVSGSTVTMQSAGTCALTANQAGDTNYSAAPQASLDVVIGAGNQAITFGAQAAQAFVAGGMVALDPVATASSGLPVSYGSQTAGVCTISGSTVTMESAGICTIAADQAGSDDYAAAATVTRAIAIGKAAQAITGFVANPEAPTYASGGTFAVSATGGDSGNPVVFASTSPQVCAVSGSTVTMQSAGTCALTADQTGDTNYSAAPQASLDVVIGAGSQAITFGVQAERTFVGGGTFALDPVATASSGLPVSYATQSATVCTISGSTVTMQSAGTCTIAADQAGSDDYAAAATVTRAIAIGKAAQAIIGFVANPEAPTFASGGTFAVSATGGDSANPVVFTSTSSQVCAVSGSTVTMQSAGTCALTADQAGSDDYAAAAQATLEVAIAAATPTLAWLDDLQKILGEPAFDLPDPSSDSAGAFSFESSNTEVATVSGSTVTIIGTGTTTLVATQAAKGNYTEGTVSLILAVMTRPDPTLDPEVVGGLQAQVDASVRFANAQQDNIRDRLRQLRDGRGNPSANSLAFSVSAGHGPGLSLGAEQVAGGMPTLAHGWGLWMAGTVALGERDTRGGANGFDFRSDGVTLGVDRLFGEQLVLGVAGGLGWNDTDFDDSPSQQDARQRSVAFYGLWRGDGPLFVDGQLGLGRLDFDLWRWSTVADATARARRDGDQLFGGLTFGYEHAGEHGRLAGYGRYDASHTTLDAYRERGLGIYDLSYDRQTIDNSTLALGVEGSHQFKTTTASLRPFWSIEYRQALENRGDARLNYVLLPVAQDYLLGMRSYNDDTLAFGAGLDIDLDSGWSLSFLLRREQSSGAGSANSFGLRFTYGQASTVFPGLDPTQTTDPRTGQSMQPH